MKMRIAKMGVGAARKNPRAAVGVVLIVARNSRKIAKALKARRTARAFDWSALVEPAVRDEIRESTASFREAIRRAQNVGLNNAVSDKQVAKHVDRAVRHASNALAPQSARKARRAHSVRTAMAGVLPLTALVALYGAWRLKTRD
jgi:hypothetical protein